MGRGPRRRRAAQGFAFEELHDEEVDSVLVADVVERCRYWSG